jgi:serine/threonine-protein kinase RsbW
MPVGVSQHVQQSLNTREVLFNPLLEFQSLTPIRTLAGAVPCLAVTGTHIQSEFGDMAHAQVLSPRAPAFRSLSFVELRQSLPGRISIIFPFVEQLVRFIARFRSSDGSELDIEMALREALANAIVHGNQQDPRKSVYVACRCTMDGEITVTVEDEGQGFDVDVLVDPTAHENRLVPQGRGIYLMKTFMDEVCFEKRGAVVFMRKASNARPGARR